jgi:DNA-binding NtrC family response regulator
MRPVLDLAQKVAATRSSVLIFGESGTGKELLARLIHEWGPRRSENFVRIPCANLPDDLLESELFGAERGAFSGAAERKIGRMEKAHRGTVYFDEILALSPAVQAKLLRLLQERSFERLGGQKTIRVDLRFVASTSTPPEQAARDERLRRDLYYRLNVVSLRIPPLRERQEDILRLAQHFLHQARSSVKNPPGRLTPAAKRALTDYRWPGNVRELKNVIERAVILASGRDIAPDDLGIDPASMVSDLIDQAAEKQLTLKELERAYIEQVLRRTRGNRSKAARILGISRKTLLEKRRRYGLD